MQRPLFDIPFEPGGLQSLHRILSILDHNAEAVSCLRAAQNSVVLRSEFVGHVHSSCDEVSVCCRRRVGSRDQDESGLIILLGTKVFEGSPGELLIGRIVLMSQRNASSGVIPKN